jgi:YT521-B-like domain
MASSIAENVAEIADIMRRADTAKIADATRTIPAPATEFAPRGHIIDDSARGIIFWEAELTDEEQAEEVGESEAETQAWAKPFKIEWIATTRVPFYRTRGLRNPWNANREVKIARDGTELEPRIGKRLIQLFHGTSMAN